MGYSIPVLYGSVRRNRQGIRAANYVVKKLVERGHNVTLIDPLEHRLPLLDLRYNEYDGDAPDVMEELHRILDDGDAFVIVAGEYNHGIPPALKNLLDTFQYEYYFKPAGIVSYSSGVFGGVREAIQLRATLGELGMVSTPTMFPVPEVKKAFDREGNPLKEEYDEWVVQFLDELEWYAEALKNQREKGKPF